ncbi:ribosome recycling factor [bacterium]|nr:ribosome recycling factor [bacterium]
MDEDLKMIMDELSAQADKSIDHLKSELGKLRAGKAMPGMLDSVQVEYYGSKVPLSQVANVSTPDARTLMVKPWEKSLIEEIERGIAYANLGLNPQNDGEQVIINIPILTEERRLQLVKNAKSEGENAKISLRNARRDAMDMVKSLQKDGMSEDAAKGAEADIQKIIDDNSARVDKIIAKKEEEITHI